MRIEVIYIYFHFPFIDLTHAAAWNAGYWCSVFMGSPYPKVSAFGHSSNLRIMVF